MCLLMRLLVVLGWIGLAGCQSEPDKLFTQIDADESGVTFTNTLTPDSLLNAFTFTNFYNGGGVGVGDFNRDGRPDLFFTGNQVSCRLYVNQTQTEAEKPTQLRFLDVTESAGLQTDQWCTGVSIADVNADGWADIYVCVAAHPTFKKTRNLLYINQRTPSPTFREEAARYGLDYAGFSTQAAFFDYDRDTDLDCFLLNTSPDLQNPNSLRSAINDGSDPSTGKLYENTGSAFTDVSARAGIRFEGLGLGVVVSDLNGDGWSDLYCSNDFMSSDMLYLNKGAKPDSLGRFRNVVREAMPHTSLFGMGVDAADLTNDGRPDILQLDMLPETNERLKQMLAGQDYDKKELSLKPQFGYQLQYMRNMLQINTGNQNDIPKFSDLGLLAGVARTDWSWATLLADLDLDGQRDIFITNGYRKNVTDRDFINFTEDFSLFGTDEFRNRQRDKLLDKVPEIELRNYAYRHQAGLSFQNVSAEWGLDELSFANGAAYADLDRDGDLDLVVNNIDKAASLFQNNSRQKTQHGFLGVTFAGPPANPAGLGATVTTWANTQKQVYENQPIRGYLSSVESAILLGAGRQSRFDSVRVMWSDGRAETRYQVSVNSRLTFQYTQAKGQANQPISIPRPLFQTETDPFQFNHTESDFVDFKTTPALHKMLSRQGTALATGDLNSDGLDDVVVGPSYRGNEGMLFFGQKNGGFLRKQWLANTPMEAGDVLLLDADNDRDLDVVLVGGGNERPLPVQEAYQPQLFRNDGQGNLTPDLQALPAMAVSSMAARALDYDRDGNTDILLTGRQLPGKYPMPARSYLLHNDKGRFIDVTQQVAPSLQSIGMVCDALPLDIDRDGDTDLILVGEWMPPTLLLNQNGQKLQPAPWSLNTQKGWWNCLTANDFDHDGDLDLLLGNEGLNTFYQASPNQPVQILAKDFNNDGLFDPIMGYFMGETCYPALPRELLNAQIIQFRRQYKRYADYANATFDDLFTASERTDAYQAQVTQLQSCYAENTGNGQFRLRPLPRLVQQSPVFGFLVDDFNRDGHLDALVTGNFYPNEVNMGRQDASRGLLLKGNGKGDFTALGPETTGFRVIGDARRSYWLKPGKRVLTAVNSAGLVVHSW